MGFNDISVLKMSLVPYFLFAAGALVLQGSGLIYFNVFKYSINSYKIIITFSFKVEMSNVAVPFIPNK